MAAWSWSERPRAALLYALTALVALAELAVFALALTPDVHPVYRAFFIDKTTTCLEKPVSGAYAPGTTLSFRPDGGKAAEAIKLCGWSGPVGDGTHSIGTSSRFRIALPPDAGALGLTLAMTTGRVAPQRVVVSANGVTLGEMTVDSPAVPTQATFELPAAVVAASATLDIAFGYPDAFLPGPRANEIYSRAVKLLTFRLAPAGDAG